MSMLLLNFEPKHPEGRMWGIELPTGERVYTRAVIITTDSRAITVSGNPRPAGYLQIRGELQYGEDVSRILPEARG